MNQTRRQISGSGVGCSSCVSKLVSCFTGLHEGRPVAGRFYCQEHFRQVLVFADGAVIEVPDDTQPAALRRIDVLQRLGSVIRRKRPL